MSKRSKEWNEKKLKRYLKEGRGRGEGKDYKPWLTVQDFPSLGRVSRIFGFKAQRIHHLFTDLQRNFLYLLEWEDAIIDIREHYPLMDIDIIEETDDLNFKFFTDKESGVPYILTTNFLITIKKPNGEHDILARSVKSSFELEKKKTIEKFEIERRYWEQKKIDWGIVTEKETPLVKVKNIEWIHSCLFDEPSEETNYYSNLLLDRLLNAKDEIRRVTKQFDLEYSLEVGTGLSLFKSLIATKTISVNMDNPIDLNEIPKIFSVRERG